MLKIFFRIFPMTIIGILFFCGCGNSASTDKSDKDSVKTIPIVSVYYLHQKKSCMTCKAVGSVSKATTEENFSKEMKEGKVVFLDLDISDPANSSIADKFECTWAGLYIYSLKNGKETAVDLTDIGFMYAVNNPDSLKQVILSTISEKLQN
jgi:hypothetical protein